MNTNANYILSTLESHGYEAYYVGGCVRDILLGKVAADFDITTNCLPDTVESLFKRTRATGKKFGTITVILTSFDGSDETFEITTFRCDQGYIDGRRPTSVAFSSDLKTDVERRDFTINAMAMDRSGKVYDYHNGQKHLLEKRLLTVGNPDQRFSEDYLRILRGIRFSSTLSFDLDPSVEKSILKYGSKVDSVSKERIYTEMIKLLVSCNPYHGLQYMYVLNIWPIFFPNIDFQRIHKSSLNKLPADLIHRLVYLYHQNHIEAIERSMGSFNLPKKTQKKITSLLIMLNHISSSALDNLSLTLKHALLNISRDDHAYFLEFLEIFIDTLPLHNYHSNTMILDTLKYIITNKSPLYMNDLAINGKDLMAYGIQGPSIGKTLLFLQQQVIITPGINVKSDLLYLAQNFSCDIV